MKTFLERIGKGKNMAKKINSKGGGTGRKQTFTITAPDALSVQLMGDFTQWQEHPINMKKGTGLSNRPRTARSNRPGISVRAGGGASTSGVADIGGNGARKGLVSVISRTIETMTTPTVSVG